MISMVLCSRRSAMVRSHNVSGRPGGRTKARCPSKPWRRNGHSQGSASSRLHRYARGRYRSARRRRGRLGELPGEPLLNISEIVRWFREVTHLSPQDALDLAHQPRSRGAKIALQLRDIKNDLGVFEPLEGSALLNGYSDIIEWLRIRKTLP